MPIHLIHRYWQGPLGPPVDHRRGLEAVQSGPVIDWTPVTLPYWITDLIASSAQLVPAHRRAVHASNVARVGLLWQFGGWWADHDLEPLGVPWTDLPWPATAAHRNGSRCNAWLGFPAGHPALELVLDAIAERTEPGPASCVAGCHLWRQLLDQDLELARVPFAGWARHHRWTSSR